MYKEIKFTIKSIDGTSIPAIYAQDTARNPSKHIILLHGISTDKNEYLNFYRILSEKLSNTNIATLRIDFRGHGDSPSSPSDFSISSQLLDLAEAIKWLEHNKKVKKISLVASSFGAPPCLFALDIFNSKIDEITLIAPVLDYFKTFINPTTKWGRSLFKNIIPKSIIRKEKISITDKFYLSPTLVGEMLITKIEPVIKKSDKVIKVIHGTKDSMVDFSISKEMSKKYKNIKLFTFERMDHGFTDYDDDEGTTERTKNNIDRIIKIILNLEK